MTAKPKPVRCQLCDLEVPLTDIKNVPVADYDLRLCPVDARLMNDRLETFINRLRATRTHKDPQHPDHGKPLNPISLRHGG